MNAIEVRGLTKRFGDFVAVNKVSFDVQQGELFGLLGPNGAGKTTLIRMLTTLTPVTDGSAFVAGYDVRKDPNEVRNAIGVIPQALTSDPELTAVENLNIHAKLYGVPPEQRAGLITERVLPIRSSARFLAACAGGWKSRAVWCTRRKFSFSMNRPPDSIPFRARTSGK
jgi:ABC-type multidrug transport system ATPase subunit